MKKYLNNKHFQDVHALEHGQQKKYKLTRLSSKAVKFENDDFLSILYVNTVVMHYNKKTKSIKLNTNGWQGNTSKQWINHGLALAGFDYYIQQKAFKWYIVDGKTGKEPQKYQDNIILNTTLKDYTREQVASGRFND